MDAWPHGLLAYIAHRLNREPPSRTIRHERHVNLPRLEKLKLARERTQINVTGHDRAPFPRYAVKTADVGIDRLATKKLSTNRPRSNHKLALSRERPIDAREKGSLHNLDLATCFSCHDHPPMYSHSHIQKTSAIAPLPSWPECKATSPAHHSPRQCPKS